jgi:hypothetical protein
MIAMRSRGLNRHERLDLVKAALLILAILAASLYISLHVDPESLHATPPETHVR